MKLFKRILAGVVSAAVIVSAMAVPAAALSSTPKTDSKSGTFKVDNKTYSYGGDLVATNSYARASASCTMNTNMGVSVTVYTRMDGKEITLKKEEDTISGMEVSVTCNNIVGNRPYDLTKATGKYVISAASGFDLTVS